MTPDSKGEWITCPKGKDVCINCCPCCDSGLHPEIRGVYLAVAFGRPWNGFMTPVVTREVPEGLARMLADEGLDDAMLCERPRVRVPSAAISPTSRALIASAPVLVRSSSSVRARCSAPAAS